MSFLFVCFPPPPFPVLNGFKYFKHFQPDSDLRNSVRFYREVDGASKPGKLTVLLEAWARRFNLALVLLWGLFLMLVTVLPDSFIM